MARELHFEDSRKQAAINALDLDAMQHEIEQMEATCMRLESPVVWSHNDLLSGNVMVTEQVSGWPGMGWLETRHSRKAIMACILVRCDSRAGGRIASMDWHGCTAVVLWAMLTIPFCSVRVTWQTRGSAGGGTAAHACSL